MFMVLLMAVQSHMSAQAVQPRLLQLMMAVMENSFASMEGLLWDTLQVALVSAELALKEKTVLPAQQATVDLTVPLNPVKPLQTLLTMAQRVTSTASTGEKLEGRLGLAHAHAVLLSKEITARLQCKLSSTLVT